MDNEQNIEQKTNENKKGKKGLIICIALALIVIAIVCACFMMGSKSKPKSIFKSFVNKLELQKGSKINEIKAVSTNIDLSAKLSTEDEEMQTIFNEISKCKLQAGAQLDIDGKKEIVQVGLKYSDQDVIDAKLVYDSKDIYAYLDGIFDKYIKINSDEEQLEELNNVFEKLKDQYSNLKSDNSKEVIKIIKNILNEEIDKMENIEQEKTTIKIGDKEKKVRNSTIKLTAEEFTNLFAKIFLKLSELDAYSDEQKTVLKDSAKQLENASLSKEDYILISVYTEGINNNFVGINFTVYVKEQDMNISMEVLKKDKNSYEFSLSGIGQGANVKLASGEIIVEKEIDKNEEAKGRVDITVEIPAVVTKGSKINAGLSIGYDVKVNPTIDTIDTTNNVGILELQQQDYLAIMNKLQQRPLIGSILSMMNSMSMDFDF